MTASHTPDGRAISRRQFLSGLGALIAVTAAGIAGRPLLARWPSTQNSGQGGQQWLPLGPLASLVPGQPAGFPFTRKVARGTSEVTQTGVAYALTRDGQNVRVVTNVCTHAGCRLVWRSDRQVFQCPCHASLFSPDGTVLAGPATRPLEEIPARVEDGQIHILLAA